MKHLILLLTLTVTLFGGYANDIPNTTKHLSFIENKGQVKDMKGKPADNVIYTISTPDLEAFITTKGITYLFKDIILDEPTANVFAQTFSPDLPPTSPSGRIKMYRLDMDLKKCIYTKK